MPASIRADVLMSRLSDLLNEDADELIGGMFLLTADQRSELARCLSRAQYERGDHLPVEPEGECQTPEVRYVQSSDQAVSGDGLS